MRLTIRRRSKPKLKARTKKRLRIRKTVSGSTERPRLSVFRSLSHIYAQLVDDVTGKTIVSASSLEVKGTKVSGKEMAKQVGEAIAKKASEKKIEKVVFDRGGYVYHGRVKALADGAREGGLKF